MVAGRFEQPEERPMTWQAQRIVEVYKADDGYRWRRKMRANGGIVAESGEAYVSESNAVRAATLENLYVEVVVIEPEPQPAPSELQELEDPTDQSRTDGHGDVTPVETVEGDTPPTEEGDDALPPEDDEAATPPVEPKPAAAVETKPRAPSRRKRPSR